MTASDETPGPLLFSLNGKPAPNDLGAALATLAKLPDALAARLEELLLPLLGDLPEDQRENRIARACRRNDIDPDVVGPGLSAAAFLFRKGAAFDVDGAAFGQDLRALGCDALTAGLLQPLYDQARGPLRMEFAQAALAAHGKVLAGIEWRIDNMASSSRGRGLNLPIALVTFHYQDGNQTDRITLQMLPEMVGSLRGLCDELLDQ